MIPQGLEVAFVLEPRDSDTFDYSDFWKNNFDGSYPYAELICCFRCATGRLMSTDNDNIKVITAAQTNGDEYDMRRDVSKCEVCGQEL